MTVLEFERNPVQLDLCNYFPVFLCGARMVQDARTVVKVLRLDIDGAAIPKRGTIRRY